MATGTRPVGALVRAAGALVLAALAGCLSWPDHLLVEGDDGSSQEAGPCPAACINTCAGGTCKLRCDGSSAACTCPPGMACEVDCSGANSCGGTVDCTKATSCSITCGRSACTGQITCGAGPCAVDCTEEGSCRGGVDCSRACSCEVKSKSSPWPVQVTCPPFCDRGCSAHDDCNRC